MQEGFYPAVPLLCSVAVDVLQLLFYINIQLHITVLHRSGELCLFLAMALHCALTLFHHHHHHTRSVCPSVGTVPDSGWGHFSACMSEVPCLSPDLAEVSELGEGFKPQRSLC